MKVKSWREDSTSKDNRKNDGDFSPEKIDLASAIKGRKGTIDRRVWTLGELLGTFEIWLKGFTLWHFLLVLVDSEWREYGENIVDEEVRSRYGGLIPNGG